MITITGYEAAAAKKAVFPTHMEKDLAEHVQALADMFHGLNSISKCTILAYNYAVANHVPVPESWKVNDKAATDWWRGLKVETNFPYKNLKLHPLQQQLPLIALW